MIAAVAVAPCVALSVKNAVLLMRISVGKAASAT